MFRLILSLLFVVLTVFPALSETGKVNAIHQENDIACIDCHGTATPEKRAATRFCIECHSEVPGSVKEYLDRGNQLSVNVHDSHDGQLRCTLCHSIHKESELYCNSCHVFEVNVP
jgi:hypothetical protein